MGYESVRLYFEIKLSVEQIKLLFLITYEVHKTPVLHLFLVFSSIFGYSQKLNPKLQKVVDTLISHIDSIVDGINNDREYPRYENLKGINFYLDNLDKAASEDELVTLMSNRHTVIKCYAFSCLAHRHSKHVLPPY